MNRRTVFSNMGHLFLILDIVLAIQLLPIDKGFCAEEPAANFAAGLEDKIYLAVKELDYPDQVAQDFVKMVHPWKCDILHQKLYEATQDVKQSKMSWSQFAKVEQEIVNKLAQTIKTEINGVDTNIESNTRYYDLALVVKEKKAHCSSYSQLFNVLGNSIGLTIQTIAVDEHSQGTMPAGMGHIACKVDLHNGKAIQVDLTLKDQVSKEYSFTEEYDKEGNYWTLKNKNNPLHIHPRIQLLDRKGVIAGIYVSRGIAHSKSQTLTEAFSDFNSALELNPKYALAYYSRGNAYLRAGKLTEAASDFNNAIELNPKFALAYNNRGVAYGKSGKYIEAISDFNKAIELNPKYALLYYCRGNTYLKSDKLSEAVSDYNMAIELNPHYAEAYAGRGAGYSNTGKLSEAISDFNKAIELNPKYADVYTNRGITYGKLNKTTEAISDFDKAIELNPKHAEAYFCRGSANISLGKTEDAKMDLRKAMQLNPGLEGKVKRISDQYKMDVEGE